MSGDLQTKYSPKIEHRISCKKEDLELLKYPKLSKKLLRCKNCGRKVPYFSDNIMEQFG